LSAKVWAEITKKNLGKSIAIVIDDQVFAAPYVRSSVDNGECMITGNLSQKEINYLIALVNEQLPVSFNLIK
jgi:SecD/SecF fusion protein